MTEKKYENLYVATRDFLACIYEAQIFYSSQKYTIDEETSIRAKMSICFENYIQIVSQKEYNFGTIMTKQSREVVEIMINEFMEVEHQDQNQVAQDLNCYKKRMNEIKALSIIA